MPLDLAKKPAQPTWFTNMQKTDAGSAAPKKPSGSVEELVDAIVGLLDQHGIRFSDRN